MIDSNRKKYFFAVSENVARSLDLHDEDEEENEYVTSNNITAIDQIQNESLEPPSLEFVARYLAKRVPLSDRELKFSPTHTKHYRQVATGKELVG